MILHSDRFLKVYESLKEKMPYLKTLAMSFRSSEDATQVYYGMLLYEGQLYESKKAKLHVITDQIGTGDAFVQVCFYGLTNNLSGQETIDWANSLRSTQSRVSQVILPLLLQQKYSILLIIIPVTELTDKDLCMIFLKEQGVLPLITKIGTETAKILVQSAADSEIKIIEFAARSEDSKEVFAQMVQFRNVSNLNVKLAVGSVLSARDAAEYHKLGARLYCVSAY